MRNLKPLIAAMVLVAPAAGAYWWVTSNKELVWALTRGDVNKTSSSTRPYEIGLRVGNKGNILFEEGTPPKEWILHLPRNYVTREHGSNGDVEIPNDDGESYFSVNLDVNVDPEKQTFTPSVGKTRDQLKTRSMIFSLRNHEALDLIADNDLCVPRNKEKDILGPLGYIGARNNPCHEAMLYCRISMHMNGWYAELGVTRDLYENPEKACALARKFLDQYTIKRDELR
jgi:hypothetical protein